MSSAFFNAKGLFFKTKISQDDKESGESQKSWVRKSWHKGPVSDNGLSWLSSVIMKIHGLHNKNLSYPWNTKVFSREERTFVHSKEPESGGMLHQGGVCSVVGRLSREKIRIVGQGSLRGEKLACCDCLLEICYSSQAWTCNMQDFSVQEQKQ